MMLKLLVISILLMAVITALMSIRILLKKNGRFPNTRIGGNRTMARRGIFCASVEDKIARKDRRHLLKDTLS
jgi:hypothetical protein